MPAEMAMIRRDLGDQPVSDGQDTVDLQGFSGGNAVLGDADDRASHDIDHGHDHSGNAVPLDELHGPVHRPEHLAFLADGVASFLGFLHINDAGAHVRVNGHLLAWHGVQGEARAHFGHPFRTLGDDQKLHDGENEKDHRADHKVAAKRELSKVWMISPRRR